LLLAPARVLTGGLGRRGLGDGSEDAITGLHDHDQLDEPSLPSAEAVKAKGSSKRIRCDSGGSTDHELSSSGATPEALALSQGASQAQAQAHAQGQQSTKRSRRGK